MIETNLTKLHNQIDHTQITNYDNPVASGLPIEDLLKAKQERSQLTLIHYEATPVQENSQFLQSILYPQLPEPEPTKPPEEEEDKEKDKEKEKEKEKEKLRHIEKILNLRHKDGIDQIEIEQGLLPVKPSPDGSGVPMMPPGNKLLEHAKHGLPYPPGVLASRPLAPGQRSFPLGIFPSGFMGMPPSLANLGGTLSPLSRGIPMANFSPLPSSYTSHIRSSPFPVPRTPTGVPGMTPIIPSTPTTVPFTPGIPPPSSPFSSPPLTPFSPRSPFTGGQ